VLVVAATASFASAAHLLSTTHADADAALVQGRAASYIYHRIDTPGDRGEAFAISDDRTVVGEYTLRNNETPFVYTPSSGTHDLPLDSGFDGGLAATISPDGTTIGGSMWNLATEGCTVVQWHRQPGTSTYDITHLVTGLKAVDAVGCDTEPTKIGNDGLVTITVFNSTGGGYTWQNGALTKLSTTPLGSRQAADGTSLVADGDLAQQVNPDGSVIPLTPLLNVFGDGPREVATAISDYDEAIGISKVDECCGGTVGAEVDHAVRWNSDGSVVDLNDVTGYIGGNPGVTLETARGLNAAGDIVGEAFTTLSVGSEPMWLEVLPPVVFVPGVAGSRLIDAQGNEHWLGLDTFHDALGLSGPDAFPGPLYADRVLQWEGPCSRLFCPGPLQDLIAYGAFVDAMVGTGMVEYSTHTDFAQTPKNFVAGRLTTSGCDTTQRDNNPDLFLFPYDWRQSNATSAAALKDFMGCVRKFYTGPVVLVAHSMGGLISRRYILDNPGYSNGVNQLVTVATPWLGAPKLINAMLTGDFVPSIVMTNATVKKVVPTMFGPRELAPSQAYYFLAKPPLYENGADLNGNHNHYDVYGPADVNALFDTLYPGNAAVTADSLAFHANHGQDDWSDDSSKVHYTVIYGVQKEDRTIGRIVAHQQTVCAVLVVYNECHDEDVISTIVTQGDGTVPVVSTARQGNGLDLNSPDPNHEELVPLFSPNESSDDLFEHDGLMRNPTVINKIEEVASRTSLINPASTQLQAASTQSSDAGRASAPVADAATDTTSPSTNQDDSPAPAWYVEVSGFTGDVAVVAPDGTSDAPSVNAAPSDASVRPTLPGVAHIGEGDGRELVVVPFTGADTFKLEFSAGSDPLMLDVRRGQQEAPDALARWNDLSVPAGSLVTVTLDASGSESLSYTDTTTRTSTAVTPTASVSGFAAQFDLTPPTVSVGSIVLGGTRQYTLTATPGSPAAVTRIMWSDDGSTFQPYTGPIALDPSVTQLTAFADDAAGNRSTMQTLDLASAPISPATTVVTSPKIPSSGYVAGPVTVLLHTRASDGTTISLTYSISDPPKATTTTIVNGDTASFTLTADGAYTIRYHATDSAGDVEAEQVLSLGVDQTAPSVAVTTPAQGSTIGTLSTVAGTATDSGSNVTSVEVAVERNSDQTYWDGAKWTSEPVFRAAAGTNNWSLPGPLPQGAVLFAGGYSVLARATDGAGNTTSATNVFTVSAGAQIYPLNLPAGFSGSSLRTRGYAINSSGQVSGEVGILGGNWNPVRWDGSGNGTLLQTGSYGSAFQPCNCVNTLARGIDDSGMVAGRLPNSAARWLPDGTAVLLTSITGLPSAQDRPAAMNNLGVVAGLSSSATWGTWTGSSFAALPVPPGNASTGWLVRAGGDIYPMGINSAGTVVGTRLATTPSGNRAAATVSDPTAGASFLFPPDTGWNSYATSINDAGDIVGTGGTADAPFSPDGTLGIPFLRYADGTLIRFPTAPRDSLGSAIAMDINNSDVIVGLAGNPLDGDGGIGAWVIYNGVVKTLADLLPPGSGWTLNDAWAINDAGQIVGNGVFNGAFRGYVLTLGGLQQLDTPPSVSDVSASTAPGTVVTVALHATTTTTRPLVWSVVDQPAHGSTNVSSGSAVYTPDVGFTGQDTFTVQASDGTLPSNIATVTVTVGSPPPAPPVASINAPSAVVAGTRVEVDALDSYDPTLGPLMYKWDLNGDGTFSGPTTAVAYLTPEQPGQYTIGLTVTNAAGVSAATRRTISVVARPSTSIVVGTVNLTPAAPTTDSILTATPDGFSGGSGPLTYSYRWFNGSHQLASTSSTLNLSVSGNGDRDDIITVDVTASDGQSTTPDVKSEVQIVDSAPTVTVAPTTLDATYSDPLTTVNVVAHDPDSSDSLSLSAAGLPDTITLHDSGDGSGRISGIVTGPAGTYHASVGATDGSLSATTPLDITVQPESASVTYTGPSLVSTGSTTATTATVPLQARVTQADDGSPGDLTKAMVAFDLYSSQNTSATPDKTVLAAVDDDGIANASVTGLGSDTWTIIARIPTGNPYFEAPPTDGASVMVYQPEPGKFVVGGGWVTDPSYLDKPVAISAANSHGNFGFNVHYDKNAKLSGQFVYVFRGRDGFTYTIKSNSWANGQFAITATSAAFSAQCNVTVENPNTGLNVPGVGGGGYSCRLDVTNSSGPLHHDSFAITITSPTASLYHRAGTSTQQLPLGGGSIMVHA
jgi:hypothetical protein